MARVMTELGDKFLAAFAFWHHQGYALKHRRHAELAAGMVSTTMHSRCLSNLIPRQNLGTPGLPSSRAPGTSIRLKGATRRCVVGAHLGCRIKRHHAGDEISTYPTRTAIEEFWQQGEPAALPGAGRGSHCGGLSVGRYPRIGAPCCGFATGRKDHVIWVSRTRRAC